MTAGRNKGKKYVKLQGWEEPTPESEARAKAFIDWYGANCERLKGKIYAKFYDDELATDTALMVYDNIALKRFIVDDHQAYFLRAYHTNRIAKLKRAVYETPFPWAEITLREEAVELDGRLNDDPTRLKNLRQAAAYQQEPDAESYGLAVDQLNSEMLDYVRAKYDPLSVSLFEIYVGLLPDTSYKRLSELLGIPVTRIWTSLGEIRKDLAQEFQSRKDFLLSLG